MQYQLNTNKRKLDLENGDILWILGDKRVLTVLRENRKTARVKVVMDRIILWIPYEADYNYKFEQLEKWYRKEAKRIIEEKAEQFSEIMEVSYADIHIKDQRSRWGSCSSLGNLNFNWRIIMAPEPVCDYIIIHELCHLVFMDHSVNFWNLVEKYSPQYVQYKKWLKNNADILYFYQNLK